MTQTAYPWIRKVEEALQKAKILSSEDGTPSFPWQEFSSHLSKLFQVKNFALSGKVGKWLEQEKLLSGMGEKPSIHAFSLTPLIGNCYLAMPQEDISRLTNYLLTKDHSFKGFSDRNLKEGFFVFLLLRSLHVMDSMQLFGNLSPKLSEFSSLPKEGAFCMDIAIEINSLKLWARVICPKDLKHELLTHFEKHKQPLLTEEMAKQIEAPLYLEIGNTNLRLEEWEKVAPGDFIILDRCTFDPQSGKGSGTLALGTTPLFQVRVKDEGIKIADYAFFQEEILNNESESIPPIEENHLQDDFAEELPEAPLWSPTEESNISQEPSLTLTIEIGRMLMSVDKILHLKPGSHIEHLARSQLGVDVTINGKKVAAGELIKLGEVLGVRILEME